MHWTIRKPDVVMKPVRIILTIFQFISQNGNRLSLQPMKALKVDNKNSKTYLSHVADNAYSPPALIVPQAPGTRMLQQ